MKIGERFSVAGMNIIEKPIALIIKEDAVAQIGEYGDIVTIKSSDGGPARDWRTGIPVPTSQRFVLTKP